MPLTPEDVVRKTFRAVMFRGYAPDEVDSFLEEIVIELRRLRSKVDDLQAKVDVEVSPGVSQGLIEVEQLDQVRRERQSLVEEIRELQGELDVLRAERHTHEG